ncbi:MAG: low molecular weight protein arginine phosphatase [Chloroflexi bacterium]|nr:low molecular weight protein arginine phosphatase [Chloroflexota bacterium]MCL5273983.1 low molecular weight protein arginine phosphatase [Chloroflexota bacterium]
MPSILFVCTANQTRSPIAAALFTSLLVSSGQFAGDRWRVESAGTWAEEGLPASRAAQRVMQTMGLDISRHRTRCVTAEMLAAFDLILVMEQGHKEALQVEFPVVAQRVFLLCELAGGAWDVPDPGADTDDAESVLETVRVIAKLLTQGCGRIRELTWDNERA